MKTILLRQYLLPYKREIKKKKTLKKKEISLKVWHFFCHLFKHGKERDSEFIRGGKNKVVIST